MRSIGNNQGILLSFFLLRLSVYQANMFLKHSAVIHQFSLTISLQNRLRIQRSVCRFIRPHNLTSKISCTEFISLKWIYLLSFLGICARRNMCSRYFKNISWTFPYSCSLRFFLIGKEIIIS